MTAESHSVRQVPVFHRHLAIHANHRDAIVHRTHIHQADSLILPWEPCVDLFLANPPYLAAKNNDLSGYRSAQQRGQADSYLLFLALALQVVRPGGWIGLVLPDPVLARLNAASERAQLLKQVTLHHLWHLSGVFAAEVGAVVLIAQHTPPTSTHQVSWIRARWQTSPREAAATRRPNPRPPNRRAGTRGAGDLAGRPGPTGRSEKELDPARRRALADLRAGGSRHQAAEPAAAESPRRGPAAPAS